MLIILFLLTLLTIMFAFFFLQKTSLTSYDIPVTHWKPILNFHVLNEKVNFERQAIPGEVYPYIRYDKPHNHNIVIVKYYSSQGSYL